MGEKLKEPKVKIVIGVIAVILIVVITLLVYNQINKTQEKQGTQQTSTSTESGKTTNNKKQEVNLEELKAQQKLSCLSAKVISQNSQYKGLYPDMLTAVIKNNTTEVVKEYKVVFLAFDSNYLPVKINGKYGNGGNYDYLCNNDTANLVPEASTDSSYGWNLAQNHGISYLIACVKSATFFNEETWENPYYQHWLDKYKGNILPEEERDGLIKFSE